MLQLHVPALEFYDESKNEFVHINEYELVLEHSLVSIAKWEAKWLKPFLSKKEKTTEEALDYIRCMTINKPTCCVAYNLLPPEIVAKIYEYIEAPMTATTFGRPEDKATNKEVVTAEIIYYWMITFNIPEEYRKWHLNSLLALINVCSIKNQPNKKMTPAERKKMLADRERINQERKARLGTKG